MKTIFEPYIEMLSNPDLQHTVRYILDEIVPEYFWEIPASSTGKYHPAFDHGIGGVARHSVMCIRCALDLLRMQSEACPAQYQDAVIVATIFHDSFKNGLQNSGHTVHEHPLLASNQIYDELQQYNCEFADEVCSAIERHMGRWTTSKYSEKVLCVPVTHLDYIVATADYISSRKYMMYMPEGDS